ncbi:MAG: ATP-binding protein [Candidatus Neomarinimicrobiota bacterium]
MIIRNSYIQKIEPFIGKPVIKVITGMRRTGKSTFLQMLIRQLITNGVSESRILWINKESVEFDSIRDYLDLYRYVTDQFKTGSETNYLFVDEVQQIENWEKAIASFLSDNIADVFITGSNAKLFSSELATLLSGRYVEFPIYPLSFQEFLLFRTKLNIVLNQEDEFALYLKYGGLPGIHALEMQDETVFQYLNAIFSTILLKDVVSRNRIRDVGLLEKIVRFVFDNCGNVTTAKGIADYLKNQKTDVSTDTILNYLSNLQSAYLIQKTPHFDLKGKKHLDFNDKYYLGDIGLRHSILGYRDRDISGLLENVVYLELLRRGYHVFIGKQNGREIDFVAEKTNERIYLQVCYLLADQSTIEREFVPLEKIADNYPKFVLSMDKIGISERNGIFRKNLIEFLLE